MPSAREGVTVPHTPEVAAALGDWISGLAPWSHFVTLTHDARRSEDVSRGYTRVGVVRHRRLVREWFYDDVRRYDPSARWWSEMELHQTGQPHEHGMLALARNAPALSIRQAWYERAGYAVVREIDGRGSFGAAAYVAKYSAKAAAREPSVWGFGLLREASWSQTLPLNAGRGTGSPA